jgi:nucleotide-binding universal stress UspA family protein
MIDAERRALAVEVQEERERDVVVAARIRAADLARAEAAWAEQKRRREEAASRPSRPVAELPKIKIPKGQTDSLTEEEITDGMVMVDFNNQREQKHLYYTKSSYQKGVVERGRIDPYTRLPVKPETVVEYVAELDPDMPVVGARRRRKTRRRAMRRKTRRRL